MNTTLDVLDRALKGDPNALSYLTRTASIYILDTATNPSQPRIYGCWDFFNQTLTEVERYEAQYGHYSHHLGEGLTPPHLMGQHRPGPASLAPHVQMLTSLSRRAARRPPATDRALVGTCLSNAARSGAYVGTAEQNARLIEATLQTRESLLGRIAALAFDFALHSPHSPSATSAFADPVSMEGLCTIVAANAVSSGPESLRHLVADWVVPASASDQLPQLSSAAVCAHLADEAMSNRGAPAGTSATLDELFDSVLSSVVGPLLSEAVRDSDVGNGAGVMGGQHGHGPTRHLRIAAMSLRALERWCAATGTGIGKVKKACAEGGARVDIVEVISDTLYSESEAVIDAAAELLETLLKKNDEDAATMESVSLINSFMQGAGTGAAGIAMAQAEESMKREDADREAILSELVSAIGLQRFRFANAIQSEADTAVCRCLARIASSVALASQSAIRSGKMGRSANGLLDLLLKGAAHPSIHVCGICLEAVPSLISPGSAFSDNLLPILQQRAIVPASLRGNNDHDDIDVDFQEYANFRETLLSAALAACYRNNRGLFMESCASAIDEFCSAQLTPQLPYQLEAALFCMSSVSIDASRRALLVNASPAAQQAAAKASATLGQAETTDIASDAQKHDNELAKCTASIAGNPACAISNPLTLAQMCIFIAKYARWYSKTPSEGSLEAAAELALTSFNLTASADFATDESIKQIIDAMLISPVAEAATALRNMLTRSPQRFATPQALSALESGWTSSYESANAETDAIKIEDREALCSGLCRVLAALPSDRWTSSLNALAGPTIECLEGATNEADEASKDHEHKKENGDDKLSSVLTRMADEIKLLSVMIRAFQNAAKKSDQTNADPNASLITILQRAWPCLTHIAQNHGSNEIISSVLSDLLTGAVVVKESGSDHAFFLQLCNMAANIMATVASSTGKEATDATQAPMLHFVQEAIDVYGHLAESDARGSSTTSPSDKNIRIILDRLLVLSFEAVQSAAGAIWAPALEQQQGETAGEASPPPPIQQPNTTEKSPDELAAMFNLLTTSLLRCPVLLVNLSSGGATGQIDISPFARSVQAAAVCTNEKEVDVARSAMMFLKTLFDMKGSSGKGESTDTVDKLVGDVVDSSITRIRPDLVNSIVAGACGHYPREILDPAASLLHVLLRTSSPEEAESAATTALEQDVFKLGGDARRALLAALGKSAQGNVDSSTLMDIFENLWILHQGEDANTFAGGDAVAKFVNRYGQS